MKLKIRVANPISRQPTWISLRSAKRHIARGRAKWADTKCIRFLDDDPRSPVHVRKHAAMIAAAGYDRIGRMSVDQLKGIPVIGDAERLFYIA